MGFVGLADFEVLFSRRMHFAEIGKGLVAELAAEPVVVVAVMDVEAVDAYKSASFVDYAENEEFEELG